MKRLKPYALLTALLPGAVLADTTPLADFLNTAATDYTVREQTEKNAVIGQTGFSISWLDDAEIRVRNQAFEFNRQRYTFRVEPKGIGETRAGNELHGATGDMYAHRVRLLTNNALKDRYRTAIDLLEKQELAALNADVKALYEDRITVMRSLSGSMEFDVTDLIAAENKLTALTFDRREQLQRISILKEEIARLLPDGAFTGFGTPDLIAPDRIRQRLAGAIFSLDSSNIYLQYEQLQLHRAECRYNLEKAEDRRYVSFLEYSYDYGERIDQLDRYDAGKDYDVNEAYVFEVGFKIPGLTTDRNNLNRRKADYLSAKGDYERLKTALSDRIRKDTEDLEILFSQYAYLQARAEDVNAESSLKRYLQMDGTDPLILLSIKESVLKNAVNMVKIKYDIYRNYIRLMDSAGRLSRPPLRNLLSAAEKPVSE